MAILFGTTADGETLPVEVNEFGQLIAEGLPGPPGPPGPPGVGELPPDPFEGAFLGWQDGQLAWLGGSVPLPPGTFGPILEYANGVLTLEDNVNLPYQTAIFLSDEQGNQYSFIPTTSEITKVAGDRLTLKDDSGLDKFRVGDDTDRFAITEVNLGKIQYNLGNGALDNCFAGSSAGYMRCNGNGSNSTTLVFKSRIPVNAGTTLDIKYVMENTANENRFHAVVDGVETVSEPLTNFGSWPGACDYGKTISLPITVSGNLQEFWVSGESSEGPACGICTFIAGGVTILNDATMPIYERVTITAIDANVPSISVSGGEWYPFQRVVGLSKSGEGTVQTTLENTIVLRENNDEWCIGEYVTAPSQNIAVRYVYKDEIKQAAESFVSRDA